MSEIWNDLVLVAREEVRETLRKLPRALREKARALPITYEPRPGAPLLAEGLAPDTLGLFVGEDYADEGQSVLPAQIILFLENIWEMVEGDEDAFRDEVHTTLLHELGHYLGLNEDDLYERGLE